MAYDAPEYGSDILGPESERPNLVLEDFTEIANNINHKDDVKRLQRFLNINLKGYEKGADKNTLKVDGNFGTHTKEAIKMFLGMEGGPDASRVISNIQSNLEKQPTESKIIDELKEL